MLQGNDFQTHITGISPTFNYSNVLVQVLVGCLDFSIAHIAENRLDELYDSKENTKLIF